MLRSSAPGGSTPAYDAADMGQGDAVVVLAHHGPAPEIVSLAWRRGLPDARVGVRAVPDANQGLRPDHAPEPVVVEARAPGHPRRSRMPRLVEQASQSCRHRVQPSRPATAELRRSLWTVAGRRASVDTAGGASHHASGHRTHARTTNLHRPGVSLIGRPMNLPRRHRRGRRGFLLRRAAVLLFSGQRGRPRQRADARRRHDSTVTRRHTDGLQGRRPQPGRLRPHRDHPRRARDARPDGDARALRRLQAARRRPDRGLAAHDDPDRGADRDAGRSGRRGALGVLQHLLHPGPRRGGRRGRPDRHRRRPRRASRSSPGRARRWRSTGGAPSRSSCGPRARSPT